MLNTDWAARRAFIPHVDKIEERASSSDREAYLRGGFDGVVTLGGDWSWRPYRKELSDTVTKTDELGTFEVEIPRRYIGARPSPTRRVATRVWLLLDPQAQLAYHPDDTL